MVPPEDYKKRRFHKSPLRELPGADHVRDSMASLFSQLCAAYSFQADSVQNQFVHLLSLLRSQCAMVQTELLESVRKARR